MFSKRRDVVIASDRLLLRLPEISDHLDWVALRRDGADQLQGCEPAWAPDHFSKSAFRNRVKWAQKSFENDRAVPLFIERQQDGVLIGAVTLDNVRKGPNRSTEIGYWVGRAFQRQGYMNEAIEAVKHYAFNQMTISRVEAACLPDNIASRNLLEKCGFHYEGVAKAYLEIGGLWQDHVIYAALRADRKRRNQAIDVI
ncbi:MAG: GNAT family protein [Pseudomonadota bacterium]